MKSARFDIAFPPFIDHDPEKLVDDLMKYQEQFRDRLMYVPDEQLAPQADQTAATETTEPQPVPTP